jgi:hypothetical protein
VYSRQETNKWKKSCILLVVIYNYTSDARTHERQIFPSRWRIISRLVLLWSFGQLWARAVLNMNRFTMLWNGEGIIQILEVLLQTFDIKVMFHRRTKIFQKIFLRPLM